MILQAWRYSSNQSVSYLLWRKASCSTLDDHNNSHHQLSSLDETWTTRHWGCCVFSFLLAVMEVNVSLTMRYFVCSEEKMMMLCGFLLTVGKGTHPESRMDGWQDMLRCSKRQRLSRCHSLKTVQYHMKWWTGSEWDIIVIFNYDQLYCSDPCSKIKIHKNCVTPASGSENLIG